MKWNKKNIVANKGVAYLQEQVNEHGSIFRTVHEENDVGIDGFIEYVENENATGQMIAVQVKSGDSYLNKKKDGFIFYVDKEHLNYWNEFSLPVILIFYSPTLKKSAFVEIKGLIKYEEYHDRLPLKKIEVSLSKSFDSKAISENFKGILEVYKDEKILLESAEKCLSHNILQKKDGFLVLSNHPFSRDRKITIYIASKLIISTDIDLSKDALFILGYGVGRQRWSWNPNNEEEKQTIRYASEICSGLNSEQIERIIELVEGEYWNGPEGLGERALDVLSCNEKAFSIAKKVMMDIEKPIEIRAFCMYFLNQGDEEWMIENKKDFTINKELEEVYNWLFKEN